MKLKLIESAQPISKLESNIAKNILPAFLDLEIGLSAKPTKLNTWGDVYTGTYFPTRKIAKLYLYTSANEIDIWNEENSDIFVADLYAILTVGLKKIPIGCISSRDPKSVEYVLDNEDLDKEFKDLIPKDKNAEDIPSDTELIPPDREDSGYEPMTKDEWYKEKRRLNAELDEYYEKKDNPMTDEERKEFESYWKKKSNYFYNTFLHRIYPSKLRTW